MEKKIIAKIHPSSFAMSDSNFYSLSVLGDGSVYYTLCSHNIDTYARVYRYSPDTDTVGLFADLGEATGDAGKKTLPHGKCHSPIFDVDGNIYFATHYGYFQGKDGKEAPAAPPEGYGPYPGGKLIEYDKVEGRFRVLACAPPEEGIVTMNMDVQRKVIYCLTWPRGIFLYYDVESGEMKSAGQVSKGGEAGNGDDYLCLCRDLAIDPRDGMVYFTNADGEVLRFNRAAGTVSSVAGAHMRKEAFGAWDPHKGGHQGYNWRKILWNPKYGRFFGVHPKSGWLFSFDPASESIEVLGRICSEYSRMNGLYEFFRYGYLTLAMDPQDHDTLYYISGFYRFIHPNEEQRRLELQQGGYEHAEKSYNEIMSYLSLITYHIPTGACADHGVIQLEDGRYPTLTQSIAIHPNGRIYTCPWIERPDKASGGPSWQQCDLISFKNPLKG